LNAAVTPADRHRRRADRLRLDPVHADQQPGAFAERILHRAQQIGGGAGDQIADRRAGKEAELGRGGDFAGSSNRLHEIGFNG
jgi:hypothetical protein